MCIEIYAVNDKKKYINKTDPPRYNWNIVESGVKHHKPNQTNQSIEILWYVLI